MKNILKNRNNQIIHTTQPMFIEFTGLPGSGKSTISNNIIDYIKSLGYTCLDLKTLHAYKNRQTEELSVLKKNANYLFVCFKYFGISINIFNYSVRIQPLKVTANFKRAFAFLKLLSLVHNLKKINYDYVVFDEGLIQKIWQISVPGDPPPIGYLNKVVRCIMKTFPSILVHSEITAEDAIERISSRPQSVGRFDRMSRQNAKLILEKYEGYIDEVISCAERLKDTNCIRVNGTDEIEYKVKIISKYLSEDLIIFADKK